MSKDSIKNIYGSYVSMISNTTSIISFDTIFNSLTDSIISRSPNNIGELLLLLNQGINNKEIKNFFDQYASYIASDTNRERSISVLKSLLGIIRKLSTKRYDITSFIWSLQGFRDLIQFYPKSTNGYTAMSDSIFCTVTDKDSLIANIDIAMNAFNPLINDKQVHNALIKHINFILMDNKGYTYEDPRMMNKSVLSTTDFCVLMLNILIKIMKSTEHDFISNDMSSVLSPLDLITQRNNFDQRFSDVFWTAVDTVYITTYVMCDSIDRSIRDAQDHIRSFENEEGLLQRSNPNQLLAMKNHLLKGNEMITRLSQYISTIDIEYIDTSIPKLVDHIINTKNFNTLTRLISCFGNRTLKSIRIDRLILAEMVLKILKSHEVPPHNKFFAMRLVMSHNMKQHLFSLRDSTLIVTQYIMNDVQRLKEIDKLHLIDMLVELSDTTIMSSKNVLELYMYLVSDFNEQYTAILKDFLNLSEETKPDAMRDLTCMIESSALLLRNMPLLGRHSLSYLNDILSFVETICNSKQILESCTEQTVHRDLISQNNIASFQAALTIFDTMKTRFIEKIKPFVIALIKVLQSEYIVIIDTESERIMKNILGIDFEKEFNEESNKKTDQTLDSESLTSPSQQIVTHTPSHEIKIVSVSNVPEDLMDVIKCDLAINPYYIKTGDEHNETLHIIDRKTVYNLYRTKIHPFTRQPIDKKIIDDFNETPCIKQLRSDALKKINLL